MDNNQSCSTNKCTMRQWVIPVAIISAIIIAFNWVYHGILLADLYKETASFWRPEEEMKQFFPYCIARQIITAIIIVCLYCCCTKGTCGSCPKTGTKFGFKIGLLLGLHSAATYIYQPIPLNLAIFWLVGEVALGIIVGYALSRIAKACQG
jgi:hypothetical protein